MKLIKKQLLDDVSRQAQKSDRLRMNYNFHGSLEDKCHSDGSWLKIMVKLFISSVQREFERERSEKFERLMELCE